MRDQIIKILKDISKYPFVYFFILLAAVYGLILGQGIIGLTLFSMAIGILIGQNMPK